MPRWTELSREYEARRYPPTRRLDVQGEGPATARRRALQWIQSFAHEAPGSDLLLIVERARRPGAPPGPVRTAVERLLDELKGGLVEWWAPFGEGSLGLRVARDPWMVRPEEGPPPEPVGDGRTPETAGETYLRPEDDIPPELLPLARRAAEMRRHREGLSVGLTDVVLRRVWIQAQAHAMGTGTSWEDALRRIVADEEARGWDDEE